MPAPLLVLSGIKAIAAHIFGEATPTTERRVRHLVRTGDIPAIKKRGRIESRPEWLEQAYAAPDNLNEAYLHATGSPAAATERCPKCGTAMAAHEFDDCPIPF